MAGHPTAQLTGIHHVSLTVSDVEASAEWYAEVLDMIRLPITFPHHELEDTGYGVLLLAQASGLIIGLHHHAGHDGTPFDETRSGLDHLGFGVPDRPALDGWAAKLDDLGIDHSGVRDLTDPIPFSTLVFRDPDNLQLEFSTSPLA